MKEKSEEGVQECLTKATASHSGQLVTQGTVWDQTTNLKTNKQGPSFHSLKK